MGKTADYSNTKKYSNNKSFDGAPVEDGKVLVPFLKDKFHLRSGEYIDGNFTTMHLGEFRYPIGFMTIREDKYAEYMRDFWDEVNKDMELRREGRCIIGTNPDGTDKICPNTRRCKGCPHKGLLERHNKKRVEILSLDYEFENEGFDIEDDRYPSVEDQVIEEMCPEPTYEEVRDRAIAYIEAHNARHAQVIRLELEGKSIDEICIAIKLKPSRGREVINEANDALCDYLKAPHMKTGHRK